MKLKKNDKVNVNLTEAQMGKLGIRDLKNPCKIIGFYENGIEGYYLSDADGKTKAIPAKLNAISPA
jgi:hypothetical protein